MMDHWRFESFTIARRGSGPSGARVHSREAASLAERLASSLVPSEARIAEEICNALAMRGTVSGPDRLRILRDAVRNGDIEIYKSSAPAAPPPPVMYAGPPLPKPEEHRPEPIPPDKSTIDLTVLDDESGKPIPSLSFDIELKPGDGSASRTMTVTTDGAGKVVVRGVPPGNVVVKTWPLPKGTTIADVYNVCGFRMSYKLGPSVQIHTQAKANGSKRLAKLKFHTVESSDTLATIASINDMAEGELAEFNWGTSKPAKLPKGVIVAAPKKRDEVAFSTGIEQYMRLRYHACSCATEIPLTIVYRPDRKHPSRPVPPPVAVMRDKGGRVVSYRAALRIDADGAPNAYDAANPLHDDMANAVGLLKDAKGNLISPTSLHIDGFAATDTRHYIDANTIPYIAVPPEIYSGLLGVHFGDYATVYWERSGKVVHAIVAEGGPAHKIGEGSIALARALGVSNISPRNGGIDARELIYVIYAGSGRSVKASPGSAFPNLIQPEDGSRETIEREGERLLDDWGGMMHLRCGFE